MIEGVWTDGPPDPKDGDMLPAVILQPAGDFFRQLFPAEFFRWFFLKTRTDPPGGVTRRTWWQRGVFPGGLGWDQKLHSHRARFHRFDGSNRTRCC